MADNKIINFENVVVDWDHILDRHYNKGIKGLYRRQKEVASSFYLDNQKEGSYIDILERVFKETLEERWIEDGLDVWAADDSDMDPMIAFGKLPKYIHGIAVTKDGCKDCDCIAVMVQKVPYSGTYIIVTAFPYPVGYEPVLD